MSVMYIQITTRCNMYCGHCCMNAGPKGKDMSREVFDATIKIVECRDEYVCIGGGEPTVHPLFEEFMMKSIESTHDEGGTSIITNGKETRRAIMLAKLAKAGVISAELSIDNWHEDVEPCVYRAFGSLTDERPYVGDRRPYRPEGDMRGFRSVRDDRLITAGRYEDGRDECVCEGPFVRPNGDVARCGCEGSPVMGNVLDDNDDFMDDGEIYEMCGVRPEKNEE